MRRLPFFLLLFLFFVFCSLFPINLHSQTAERIERLLGQSEVSYGEAAAFVLEAADLLVDPTPGEAFAYAIERKWLPRGVTAGGVAKLDGLSLLAMRAFGVKGGLFFTATGNAHYAYRELVYRSIIQGKSDPAMAVSGYLLLFMVNRVLSYGEAGLL